MPPRRKGKQVVKRTGKENKDESHKGIQSEDEHQEAERQTAAIKANRDVEIERSLTAVRLLCSCFAEEQLQKPVLEFFQENLPGISFDEQNGEIEFKCNDKSGDLNYSILKRFSMGFPLYLYTSRGYELPGHVRATLLGTDKTHLHNLVFQGTSENRMLASHDALRTPGVNGQRLSFGMTPKTRRLPKPGEMMLSVHGSPLGVYEEDQNMGAINEERVEKLHTFSDSCSPS